MSSKHTNILAKLFGSAVLTISSLGFVASGHNAAKAITGRIGEQYQMRAEGREYLGMQAAIRDLERREGTADKVVDGGLAGVAVGGLLAGKYMTLWRGRKKDDGNDGPGGNSEPPQEGPPGGFASRFSLPQSRTDSIARN